MSHGERHGAIRAAIAVVLAGAVVAGCGAPPASGPPSLPTPAASTTSTADPAGTPEAPTTAPASAGEPPAATLRLATRTETAAAGQLGTYSWRGEGSSSPRLPGTQIAIPADAALEVVLAPEIAIASWTATLGEAGIDAPGRPVAASGGFPSLRGPTAGEWRLEIHVTFAAQLGDAVYAWHLVVE